MAKETLTQVVTDHESRISILEKLQERLEIHLQKHVNRHFVMTVWIGTQSVLILAVFITVVINIIISKG